jgi:integrase
VSQKIGPPKTEASQKPIPMNADMAKALRLWKMKTIYSRPSDWVYASPAKNGTQPYWPKSIYRVYIKRAAEKIGLQKRIGWHTFRHTFGKDASSRYSQGSDLVNGLFWTRGEMVGSYKFFRILASQSIPSWNRIIGWLKEIETLRRTDA